MDKSMANASAYAQRRQKLYRWMEQNNIDLAVFEDTEGRRDVNLRYYTGHPMDAILFLSPQNGALLAPWDVNMAEKCASVEAVMDYSEADLDNAKALKLVLERFKLGKGARVDLPPATPYPVWESYRKEAPDAELLCRRDGSHKKTAELRAVKDQMEVQIYRECFDCTNTMIDAIEAAVRDGTIKTELDAALFIEAETRRQGGEGSGFETLAAGPQRSFGIHCFPAYTKGAFAVGQGSGAGLSILDWGLKYQGYTSDITMTFVRGTPNTHQKKMISLVEEAARTCFDLMRPGVRGRDVGLAAKKLFNDNDENMPHGLGHGIGLDVHESPSTGWREKNKDVLEVGMYVTLEPGLYHPDDGGVRLEDDIYISETGPVKMTRSRIVYL